MAQRDEHHRVPKCKGARQSQFPHRVCDRKVHALLTQAELARQYATIEALLQHPETQTLDALVKAKPEDFFVRIRKRSRMRQRRR